MKVLDTKLKNFTNITNSYDCPEVDNYTKKELTDKDCYYLRYCLMRFILNNQGNIYEFMDIENQKELYYYVDEEASICSDSLCIGNFDGYQIDDDLYLHDLELDVNNRILLNVSDKAQDKFYSYLID